MTAEPLSPSSTDYRGTASLVGRARAAPRAAAIHLPTVRRPECAWATIPTCPRPRLPAAPRVGSCNAGRGDLVVQSLVRQSQHCWFAKPTEGATTPARANRGTGVRSLPSVALSGARISWGNSARGAASRDRSEARSATRGPLTPLTIGATLAGVGPISGEPWGAVLLPHGRSIRERSVGSGLDPRVGGHGTRDGSWESGCWWRRSAWSQVPHLSGPSVTDGS